MKAALIVTALLTLSGVASAQQSKIYWVVESNWNTLNVSVVKIYNEQHQLVHEETVARSFDITSRKDKRILDKKLKHVSINTFAYRRKKDHKI